MESKATKGSDPALGKWVGVEMKFDSPDGDNGFPGALAVTVTFSLYADNTLQMAFQAELTSPPPAATLVNMCNHAYWNLSGTDGRSDILDHHLRVRASAYTELDGKESMLPTGRIVPVADGPYDFTAARTIGGPGLAALQKSLPAPAGYDINYVLSKDHPAAGSDDAGRDVTLAGSEQHMSYAARLEHRPSGRGMDVWTTAPGLQVYSGNFLGPDSGVVGRGGVAYPKHGAVCLETQSFPDAINHPDTFKNYPNGVLRSGEKYVHVTQHRFFTTSATGESSGSFGGSA
jgi:aldose 1-epimerase